MLRSRKQQVATVADYPKQGTVVVETASSVVEIQTHGLEPQQFDHVKYILGETFGSMNVRVLPDQRLRVSWYVNLDRMTPTRLKKVALDALERNGASIGAVIANRE